MIIIHFMFICGKQFERCKREPLYSFQIINFCVFLEISKIVIADNSRVLLNAIKYILVYLFELTSRNCNNNIALSVEAVLTRVDSITAVLSNVDKNYGLH